MQYIENDRIKVAVADHGAELCGIYNAGSGLAETWNELVSAVFDAMGKPRRIEYIDMPEILKGKYQYHTEAEMGKLRAAGYRVEALAPVKNMSRGVIEF